jgi:hypothetical protein
MEIELHKFQQLSGTIKQVRTNAVLKFCEIMTLRTSLCRSETWTLTPQHKKKGLRLER